MKTGWEEVCRGRHGREVPIKSIPPHGSLNLKTAGGFLHKHHGEEGEGPQFLFLVPSSYGDLVSARGLVRPDPRGCWAFALQPGP